MFKKKTSNVLAIKSYIICVMHFFFDVKCQIQRNILQRIDLGHSNTENIKYKFILSTSGISYTGISSVSPHY